MKQISALTPPLTASIKQADTTFILHTACQYRPLPGCPTISTHARTTGNILILINKNNIKI
ncbi:hypothetical protein, partial [Serratia marcescens]|uniref:hypothetical protein n=1 Tax=Serratia marcescens TaxID=615 RepID=UPI0019536AB3